MRGILILVCAVSMVETRAYIVRPGDTVGSIAVREMKQPRRLHGPEGRIARLISYNPQLKNPDLIFPGEIVNLEAPAAPEMRAPAQAETPVPAEPVVAPPVLPPPAPEKPEKDLQAVLSVRQVYARIDADDRLSGANAVLISDLLTVVEAGVFQQLNPHHRVGIQASWRSNKFSAPTTGQTLDKTPGTKSIHADYVYQAGERLSVAAEAGIEQKLFARAVSATSYTFDVPQVPYAQIGFSYLILHGERKDLGLSAHYRSLQKASSAGQEISAGSGTDLSLFLRQRRGAFEFGQDVFWNRSRQNSSIVDQTETSLGVGLSAGFSF